MAVAVVLKSLRHLVLVDLVWLPLLGFQLFLALVGQDLLLPRQEAVAVA
jgi:hypothetical protein